MDRAVEVAARAGAGVEPLAGEVELAARDTAHAVAGVLAAAQAVGAGAFGAGALGVSIAGALDRHGGRSACGGERSRGGGGGGLLGVGGHVPWLPAGGRRQSVRCVCLRRPARAASVRGCLTAGTDASEAAPGSSSTR